MKAMNQIRELSRSQHGLVTVRQLRDLGVFGSLLNHRVECGLLERLSANVLRIGGSASTDIQHALAAVLDVAVPNALSHESGSALWGLPGFDLRPIHVTRLRGGRATRGQLATVHQPRLLLPDHVTTLFGVPILSPPRVLFDIAASYGFARFERAVDYALSRKLCTAAELHVLRDALGKRGRTGMTALREICDRHPPGETPRDSNLELRFEAIAQRVGVRGLERQVHIADDRGWIARVDYVHRPLRVVLECDSRLFHGTAIDVRRDEQRDERLRAAGYRVERFIDTDVFFKSDLVEERLRSIFLAANCST